jgi:hypothetical protein
MRLSPYYIPVILGLAFAAPSFNASAQVAVGIGVSVPIAPPPLPVYAQPPMPEVGYMWTPGVWQYQEAGGYYWVPGTWVRPPSIGVLWTPPYWGFADGAYGFNAGYWGASVGFYGGINYGFGYGGSGYGGGRWQGGAFSYNRSVNNFGGNQVSNAYNERVASSNVGRASFNGGTGGVQARPTAAEAAVGREQHVAPTAEQTSHAEAARANPAFRASANHGRPAVAATARPGAFEGKGVAPAKGAARMRAASASARGNRTAAHPVARRTAQHAQHAAPAHAAAAHHAAAPRQAAPRQAAPRQAAAHAQGGHPQAGGHAAGGSEKHH